MRNEHDANHAIADMAAKQQLSDDVLQRIFDAGRYQDPPYEEMACTAGCDMDEPSWWRRLLVAVLLVAASGIVCWAVWPG